LVRRRCAIVDKLVELVLKGVEELVRDDLLVLPWAVPPCVVRPIEENRAWTARGSAASLPGHAAAAVVVVSVEAALLVG